MKKSAKIKWNVYRLLMAVQESGMALITAEDLDDAADKAVKALTK